MMLDEIPELKDLVRRQEGEVIRAASDVAKERARARLAEALARLAEAEGRMDAAAKEWRKVIAFREKEMNWWLQNPRIGCPTLEVLQGPVAVARCRLAEVERRPADLAKQLPKVIAYYDTQLGAIDQLRMAGALAPEEAAAEKGIRTELRKARLRLDRVRKNVEPQSTGAKGRP